MGCAVPQSSPSHGWNKSSWTLFFLGGKRVAIPSSGECPKPFSEMAFIEIRMFRGIQYARKAHQSMSKGHSYRKQILCIDNNWLNVEICLRSGSVRYADSRGSVIKVQFMRLGVHSLMLWAQTSGLYEQGYTKQSKLQRIQCILQAWFLTRTLGVSIWWCLPPAFPAFWLRLTGKALLMQDYSFPYHSKWSPTLLI